MRNFRLQSLPYHTFRVLICLVLPIAVVSFFSVAHAEENLNRILYINSYNPGYKWSDDIERGLLERLHESPKHIEISVEYLDAKRFDEQKMMAILADDLSRRYASYNHDLIVVSDNAAFTFAVQYRDRLFPGRPIVFCGYNGFRREVLNGQRNITGVNEEQDIGGLIETAMQVQPGLSTLAFVVSTADASNRSLLHIIESEIIPAYKNRFRIVLLKDASMAEISEKLHELPKESALFLTGHTSDPFEGRAISPIENQRLITAISPLPAYALWDFSLNTGVIGGNILTGVDQGRAAADMALRILSGTPADDIPVLMKSPTRHIFDYNAMKRYGIRARNLPEGSTIINKPDSFYVSHKTVVWSGLAALAILLASILLLSIYILYRRRAEAALARQRDLLEETVSQRTQALTEANKELKISEARFRSLSDASFEGIAISEKGVIREANKAMARMFGYDMSELQGMTPMDLVPEKEKEAVKEKVMAGYEKSFETICQTKDGLEFPVEIQARMFTFEGREVRVTSLRDLSEKKKAEQEIQSLRDILPICSNCKKVRDDKGYWNQVEVYIEKHMDTSVSHGLCEDCTRELYGDYLEDDFDPSSK